MVTFVKITLENTGPAAENVRFWVAVGRVSPGRGPEAGGILSLPYAQPLSMSKNGVLLETRDGEKRVVCAFAQTGKWHAWYGPSVELTNVESRNSMLKARQSLDNVMEYNFNIAPGESREVCIRIPFYPMSAEYESDLLAMDEEAHLAKLRSDCQQFLEQGAQFHMPEKVILDAVKTLQIRNQIFNDTINGKRYPYYGAYTYDGLIYDFETEKFIEVLDLYGYHDEAQQLLENLLEQGARHTSKLAGEFTETEGYISFSGGWLYISGAAGPRTICEHFRLTGDVEWLRKMAPKLISAADWIRRARVTTKQVGEKGQKAPHYGLIPKGNWCDIQEWEHWFYISALYYNALARIVEVLRVIDEKEADKWAVEAREFKEDIIRSVDACTDRRSDPPLVPLAPYVQEPGANQVNLQKNRNGMYWAIVGPQILMDCGVLSATDERATYILRWLEEKNGLLLGIARFGPGIDAKYSSEAAITYMRRGESTKTVLTLYGYRAYAMSREACSTPEVFSEVKTGGSRPIWYGPCLPDRLANSIFLILVRNIMVREEGKELYLLDAAPRGWFENGKNVEVVDAPTYFGDVTFKTTSLVASGEIHCELHLPQRSAPRKAFLRLRHPDLAKLKNVTVNGKAWNDFDPEKESISLPVSKEKLVVEARY